MFDTDLGFVVSLSSEFFPEGVNRYAGDLTYEIHHPETTKIEKYSLKECTYDDVVRYVKNEFLEEPPKQLKVGFE